MAWSESRIFSAFITDLMNQTAAFDMNTHTFKGALYDNDITPDQDAASADTAYDAGQWVASGNEVSESGQWAAGGVALSGITSGFTGNVYTFDASDLVSGSAADLANVFGVLIYDDTLTTPVADQGACYSYLGGANSVVNGTFTVQFNASGILTLTL